MQIIPAIDLRGGKCVRLRQGDYAQETIFGDDPAEMARRWAREGAERLHLVDLDGDGWIDLVTSNQGGNSVSVLHNNANGTFGPRSDHAVGNAPSPSMVCAPAMDRSSCASGASA